MLVAFSPDLTTYHEIRANSYQTEEWFNDVGKFTLVVPPTPYNISHLVKGAILYRTQVSQAMVITRVSPDTSQDRITVNGYTTNWLLNKRAIATPTVITTVENGLYGAIASNLRGLPNVETGQARAIVQTKTSSFTLGAADAEKLTLLNSSSAINVELPNDSTYNFPIGTAFNFVRWGTGACTFSGQSGVSWEVVNSATSISAQGSAALAVKVAANTWWLSCG